ncbi:MAG: hypothetical protein RLZZ301_11 [Bacteroidota bacterium]
MRLSWTLKAFVSSLLCWTLLSTAWAQRDSSLLKSFRHRAIMYTDLGYTSSPYYVDYPFTSQIDHLAYKNNFSPFLAVGFAYKWLSFRVGFPIIGNIKPTNKFGKTSQYNFGFDYTYKKIWFDCEFKSTFGFAIKHALNWDSTLSNQLPHQILPKAYSFNAMVNGWYFHNPDFQMSGLLGKRAHYEGQIVTWYLKGSFNVFGSGNSAGPLIPTQLAIPTQSVTQLQRLQAIDIGAIPGLAYVNRKNNFQLGGWAGIGPVLQLKSYATIDMSKTMLGFAPRFDVRLLGGYTSDERFLFLVTDFDNKSIRFDQLHYRQFFYSVKIVAGYRFPEKKAHKH